MVITFVHAWKYYVINIFLALLSASPIYHSNETRTMLTGFFSWVARCSESRQDSIFDVDLRDTY